MKLVSNCRDWDADARRYRRMRAIENVVIFTVFVVIGTGIAIGFMGQP